MTRPFVWILLVIYSIAHLSTSGQLIVDITGLFLFDEEAYAVALFNLMGLFPLFFLLAAVASGEKKRTIRWHVLGFAFGAFALLPLSGGRHDKVVVTPVIRSVATVAACVSSALFMYAGLSGSWPSFYGLFMSDSLIHIMTIDFIVLYALSIRWAYRSSTFWPVACLPVIGPFMLLAISKGEVSK